MRFSKVNTNRILYIGGLFIGWIYKTQLIAYQQYYTCCYACNMLKLFNRYFELSLTHHYGLHIIISISLNFINVFETQLILSKSLNIYTQQLVTIGGFACVLQALKQYVIYKNYRFYSFKKYLYEYYDNEYSIQKYNYLKISILNLE